MLPMFDIIPRPGIPDVCKEATEYLCLNIQVSFKTPGKKKKKKSISLNSSLKTESDLPPRALTRMELV